MRAGARYTQRRQARSEQCLFSILRHPARHTPALVSAPSCPPDFRTCLYLCSLGESLGQCCSDSFPFIYVPAGECVWVREYRAQLRWTVVRSLGMAVMEEGSACAKVMSWDSMAWKATEGRPEARMRGRDTDCAVSCPRETAGLDPGRC